MKKSLLFLSSAGVALSPVVVAISCSSSSTRNQVISKITENKIDVTLKGIKALIYDEYVVGRKIDLIRSIDVEAELRKFTSWVDVEAVELYKQDKTTMEEKIVVTYGPNREKFEDNHLYKVIYKIKPNSNSKWEDGTNPTESRQFIMSEENVTLPEKILDINDFQNLKFTNYKDMVINETPINRLEIDDSKWKDQVKFYIYEAETSIINSSTWIKVGLDDTVFPGNKLRVKVGISPLGKYAWKTGDPFEFKNSGLSEVTYIQYYPEPEDFSIGYVDIMSPKKEIDINVFQGFVFDKSSSTPQEGWIELYQRTSNTSEVAEPDTFNDYVSSTYTMPSFFSPDYKKFYMSLKNEVTLDASPKKYVNFKLMYKNFFKNSSDLPYSMYASSYLESKLPYEEKNNYSKVVKENDDLVVYTYSIPYSITK